MFLILRLKFKKNPLTHVITSWEEGIKEGFSEVLADEYGMLFSATF
jgi:hypothetical protein